MLKFGIIGVGRRGVDHLQALRALGEVSVRAICETDRQRALEVSSKYNLKGYTDVNEMIEEESLDAVVICTPIPLHVSQALQCIKAGTHVLVEKPISLDPIEVKQLLVAVQKYNKIVAVGFQSRNSNLAGTVKGNINEETLSMLAGRYYWTIPIIPWIRQKSLTGGQIVEQAIHLLDLFRYFAGEIDRVYAEYTEKGRNTEEDKKSKFDNWASYAVVLRFEKGTIGTLYSTYSLYPGVFGSNPDSEPLAYMDIISRDMLIRYYPEREVRIFQKNREPEVFKTDVDATIEMHKKFIEAIQKNDKRLIPSYYEDSYKSVLVSLAANKSAETGKPIDPNTLIQ